MHSDLFYLILQQLSHKVIRNLVTITILLSYAMLYYIVCIVFSIYILTCLRYSGLHFDKTFALTLFIPPQNGVLGG